MPATSPSATPRLARHGPGTGAGLLFVATRPRFLAASLLPVLLGSVFGGRLAGGFDWLAFMLALTATALVHGASNVYNDVSDEVHGTDRANTTRIPPYTGGSRVMQDGLLDLDGMRKLALVLAVLGIATGLALALRAGPGVLAFGVAGLLLGLAYSLPRVRLAGRGLGELAIAVAFGLLPVSGAAWLQTGRLDAGAVLLSLPVSAWVAAVILANEIPDAPSDAATGKHTLAVRLGAWTPVLHALLQLAALVAIVAGVLQGVVPGWTMTGAGLLLTVGLWASRLLAGDRGQLARGIRLTLGVHAAGCLGLLVAVANLFAPGA